MLPTPRHTPETPLLEHQVSERGSVVSFMSADSDSETPRTPFPRLIFIPSHTKCCAFWLFVLLLVLSCTAWQPYLAPLGLGSRMMLKYSSIPVVAVLFTYGHIWLALWMLFYPVDWFGAPGMQIPESPWGLGWQGIVPSKARKMATNMIRKMVPDMVSLDEIFMKVDPDTLLTKVETPLSEAVGSLVHGLAGDLSPSTWNALPDFVKREIVLRVQEEIPATVRSLMKQLKLDPTEVVDVEDMVVKNIVEDRQLLNHMFITCAFTELEFIRDTGGYLGLIFGVLQMVQQYFLPRGFLLPVVGTVVGYFTNWLAIKMIFEPLEPKPLFGGRIVLHGRFLARQWDASAVYSKMFAKHVVSAQKLMNAVVFGRRSEKLFELLRREVATTVDRCAGKTVSTQLLGSVKVAIADRMIEILPQAVLAAEQVAIDRDLDKAMGIEKLLTEKMRGMKAVEFEQVIHPIFQEDEWILITLGGILGSLVGSIQWYVLGD